MKSIISLAALLPFALAQDLCDQFSYYGANGYNFNNNEWGRDAGSGNQCTHVDKLLNPGVAWHTEWNWSGGDNNVKSYPYSGRDLPTKKIVSSIGSIPSKAEWRYLGDNLRADIAYDIFTAADPNHNTYSGDYELMIWLGRRGGVQPIGSNTGTVNVGGRNWELWDGYNGPMRVYSFVAPSDVAVFESDLKPFFTHVANNRGFPASQQHLLTVQFGTEPFTGSNARFDVWYWYADIN